MQSFGPSLGYGPESRRSRALIVTVCALVLALVGGVVWWTTRSGDDAPPAGQLTREYPTMPKAAWSLTPAQVGGDAFVSLNPLAAVYSTPGPVHDGKTLLTLVRDFTDGWLRLAGINTADGSHWVTGNSVQTCSDNVVAQRIVCIGDSTVYFIDTRTGEIVASHRLQDRGFTVAYDGTAAYVRGFSMPRTLTKVTAERVQWRRTYRLFDSPFAGSEDATQMIATGELVGMAGSRVTVYSADTGQLLLDRPGITGMSALPDGSLAVDVAPQNSAGPVTRMGPVAVVRPDGTVTDIPGSVIAAPVVASGRFGDTVFVGGRPMTAAGKDLGLPVTAVPGATEVPLAADPYVVLIDSANSTLTVVDASSGTVKWSRKLTRALIGPGLVTDGVRVFFPAENGSLTAADLDTGRDEWSIPASALGGAGGFMPVVSALGEKLVTSTRDLITGFAPTGGRAAAPGSGRGKATPGNGQSGDKYVTRCGSAPRFTPESFTTSSGGLGVRLKVTATCPKGDLLSGKLTRITISDTKGSIASGSFDFSVDPLVLPSDEAQDAVTIDLTFPAGSFQRLPDTLAPGVAIAEGSTTTESGGTIVVECDPGAQTAQSLPRTRSGNQTPRTAVTAPDSGAMVTRDCGPALRLQADSDRAFITANLDGKWVSQLSSKQPGLVADGRTWDNCAILDEFLALRLRFDDARLLDSGQWPVFSYTDWWVTVATVTFAGPDAANSWCRTQGFDPDHCFAKLVSATAGPGNSTRYWR